MTILRSLTLLLTIVSTLSLVSCNRGPTPVKGDKLNDYFPKDADKLKVLVTSEKKGFAQASLKSDDNEVATLAITDLVGDAEAQKKFEGAADKIEGHPAIARGNAGTALLVGRFQIQVRSKSDAFTEADRKKWLSKFDLSGLSKLR